MMTWWPFKRQQKNQGKKNPNLVFEWKGYRGEQYRAVKGKAYGGSGFVVEALQKDALGQPQWDTRRIFCNFSIIDSGWEYYLLQELSKKSRHHDGLWTYD